MITMTGKRIILEPLDIEKHAQGYFQVSQDEKIHTFTGNLVPRSLSETEALLQKYRELFYNWMILSRENQAVIGIIRLSKPHTENGTTTAGESQFLSSQYWRKGHMKEAKKLFYHYVFEELSLDMLYADIWDGNINSMKSLESYGYRLMETRLELFSKTGEYTPKHIYTLSKDDYLSHCRNL